MYLHSWLQFFPQYILFWTYNIVSLVFKKIAIAFIFTNYKIILKVINVFHKLSLCFPILIHSQKLCYQFLNFTYISDLSIHSCKYNHCLSHFIYHLSNFDSKCIQFCQFIYAVILFYTHLFKVITAVFFHQGHLQKHVSCIFS